MIDEAKKILKIGYIPIPCNKNKIPSCQAWQKINKESCLSKIKSNNNIGILTGKISGITVIDIDVKDKGLEVWNKFIAHPSSFDDLIKLTL